MADLWQEIASRKIKPGITVEEMRKLFPELRIANDSDTSHWDKKAKALAKRTLHAGAACRMAKLDCRIEFTFYDKQLYEIKINRYGERTQVLYEQMCDAYAEVCAVLSHLLQGKAQPPRAWVEVAKLTLAASGLPNDRYEPLADATAPTGFGTSIYLEWENILSFSMRWSEPDLYIYK